MARTITPSPPRPRQISTRPRSYAYVVAGVLISALAATSGPRAYSAEVDSGKLDWRSLPVYSPPEPHQLQARQLQAISAPEAIQGAAVDREHVYAVANFAIGKYARGNGALVDRWLGERRGLIGHLNSCLVLEKALWCANSNHPEVPMASSIEVFDTRTMDHVDTKSLGLMDEGSLTWFDRFGDGWIAGFAHYNDATGEPFKSNAYAGVHLFDAQWRHTGGWRLPPTLVERMAPQAASGGALADDGLLYIFGHHRPELYVLAKPEMGPTLLHIATIALDAEGQAFAFAPDDVRTIWAISRPHRQLRAFRLPEVPLDATHAERFREPSTP